MFLTHAFDYILSPYILKLKDDVRPLIEKYLIHFQPRLHKARPVIKLPLSVISGGAKAPSGFHYICNNQPSL